MTNDSGSMERIRADLLQRALSQREANLERSIGRDLEAGASQQMEEVQTQERRRSGFGVFHGMGLPRMFGRRPEQHQHSAAPAAPSQPQEDPRIPEVVLEGNDQLESPKSPDFGRPRSTMRFTLPNFSRMWSSGANGLGSPAGTEWPTVDGPASPRYNHNHQQHSPYSHPSDGVQDIPVPPEPVTHARSTFRPPSSHYPDVFMTGLGEQQSTRARDDRQRKRRRKKRRHHHVHSSERSRRHGSGRTRHRKKPRKFLFCFPWVQSKAMRVHILRCFVSGLFLLILLSVCKSRLLAGWGRHLRREIRKNGANVRGCHRYRVVGHEQRRYDRLYYRADPHCDSHNHVLRVRSDTAVYARGSRRPCQVREVAAAA